MEIEKVVTAGSANAMANETDSQQAWWEDYTRACEHAQLLSWYGTAYAEVNKTV